MKDLETRNAQIAELELRMEQAHFDESNEEELDELHIRVETLTDQLLDVQQQLQSSRHKVSSLESSLKQQKLKVEHLHIEIANQKVELKKILTDCKVLALEKEKLEQRIDAIQSLDTLNSDLSFSEKEWSVKLELIKKSAETKQELLPFLDKIYFKLVETIASYQNYKQKAFEMKNERDKYKKLYQESQERVKEAIVKRDAVIERLNVKIEQLQREAENVIVKENVMSIPIGVPGGQMNRKPSSFQNFMSNGDGTTMTVPLKRPLVMPQTGRRAPHVPQKLQKPKVIPTSKNLLAWLDRK